MRGLELAERFWKRNREELFAGELAGLLPRAAAGLVGEGSDCWGFDDDASRDHDWGPGCCVWLLPDDFDACGAQLQARYDAVAARGLDGMAARPPQMSGSPRRVGVLCVDDFFARILRRRVPQTLAEWRAIDESALAAATNGRVFYDGAGRLTGIREHLLSGYPEDLRLLRIAAACVQGAQAGQYNLPRQMGRGELSSALGCLSRFQDAACQMAYALARSYRPFYKWAVRGLPALGPVGETVHAALSRALDAFCQGDAVATAEAVEDACRALVAEFRAQGLSQIEDPWLLPHAHEVMAHVGDDGIRRSDLMEGMRA